MEKRKLYSLTEDQKAWEVETAKLPPLASLEFDTNCHIHDQNQRILYVINKATTIDAEFTTIKLMCYARNWAMYEVGFKHQPDKRKFLIA